MAWIFELAAEFGTDREAAARFLNHFSTLQWMWSDGSTSWIVPAEHCRFQGEYQRWWCRIVPENLSRSGWGTDAENLKMIEAGIDLYWHLLSAPDFRFALVGVEVEDALTWEDIVNGYICPGLVINEALWNAASHPGRFSVFKPGYFWQPFRVRDGQLG
ncbi:MAG TPA: hypothetical protein PLB32_22045 [Acidobacteriota bacterium]|nr:hypothetical protein [Acidobacteriota bacterium]HNG95501.1 hypothetical protein [Acidobacteriota bacterium]